MARRHAYLLMREVIVKVTGSLGRVKSATAAVRDGRTRGAIAPDFGTLAWTIGVRRCIAQGGPTFASFRLDRSVAVTRTVVYAVVPILVVLVVVLLQIAAVQTTTTQLWFVNSTAWFLLLRY